MGTQTLNKMRIVIHMTYNPRLDCVCSFKARELATGRENGPQFQLAHSPTHSLASHGGAGLNQVRSKLFRPPFLSCVSTSINIPQFRSLHIRVSLPKIKG